VTLAAAVVLGGGICYVLRMGNQTAAYRQFYAGPAKYRDMSAIIAEAFHGDCRAIIQFGLLLLIATPVARVAISIAGFALEKDRTYVAITCLVLGILLYSLIGKP